MTVDGTSKVEKALTSLGMWGAIRGFLPATVALVGSVLLFESLLPSVASLFPGAPLNALHAAAIGGGLLLGFLGHMLGELWDRLVFEAGYGLQGKWLDAAARVHLIFPPGAELKRCRSQATHAMALKPEAANDTYRQAVKLARRQTARWELIEHPLVLSGIARSFLWPCLVMTGLAVAAGVASLAAGAASEAQRLLAIGVACLVISVILLASYTHLRMEHMLRLYQDIAAHPAKRK